MAKEIERKFLVTNEVYKELAHEYQYIKQGYISTNKESIIRIRIIDNKAVLTIKGATTGITRKEWEYPIPYEEAVEMLGTITQGSIIEKKRYYVNYCGHLWEIDEFMGGYTGLIVAEIELRTENEIFSLPPFIGEEVTGDPNYYNSSLALIS